jgi:multiple antibiotic resistance protein
MTLGWLDVFVLFLITVGPLKGLVVFAAVTAKADAGFRRAVAFKAITAATIVVLVFALAGQVLLDVFHVTLPALKIAGGLILLLFALHMVMGEPEKEEAGAAPPSMDIAIYPLAMPALATPQGIVAIVTIMAAAHGWGEMVRNIVLLLAVMAIDLGALLAADRIVKWLGAAALGIIARIAGILLAALAVQLAISALRDLGALAPAVH